MTVLLVESKMKQDITHIFERAQQQDRGAQKALYDMFAPRMLAIAISYVNSREDAEDILIESFCKAFQKIKDCREADRFVFWLRKIIINDAISFIRKKKNILYAEYEVEELETLEEEIDDYWPEFEVKNILSEMPIGYKLVFNLYVFEDKKHQEIAEILNINEGTSRSQLKKAKKWLVEFFNQKRHEQHIKK